MKLLLTFLFSLLAVTGWAANPAYTDFRGTNQVLVNSNVATGRIIIGPSIPISTTASNAAIALNLWTNDAGAIRTLSNAPVMSRKVFWAGSNALDLTSSYFLSSNGILVGFDATVASEPQAMNIGGVMKGPGSYTFSIVSTEVNTNRVYSYIEFENDDIDLLDTVEFAAGTNVTEMANGFGPQLQGTHGLTGNNQYFRLIPFSGNPYLLKSAPLAQSNLLSVMNNTTNAFNVDYAGNAKVAGGTYYQSNALTVGFISSGMTNGEFWVGTLSNALQAVWMSNNVTLFKKLAP